MFSNKTTAGKHMICDIYDIKNLVLLNNKELLNELLKNICNKYNFDILNEVEHSFIPYGCTILFLLSESHISIHTFPEKNYISFDIYTCREYKNNNEYNDIFYYLVKSLNASQDSECKIIDRTFNK
jgi:S-adenosylmethionine decarboxylase